MLRQAGLFIVKGLRFEFGAILSQGGFMYCERALRARRVIPSGPSQSTGSGQDPVFVPANEEVYECPDHHVTTGGGRTLVRAAL